MSAARYPRVAVSITAEESMSVFSNLLIPAVLFFALGFFARVVRSDLRFPPDLAKLLSIYLLMAFKAVNRSERASSMPPWIPIATNR